MYIRNLFIFLCLANVCSVVSMQRVLRSSAKPDYLHARASVAAGPEAVRMHHNTQKTKHHRFRRRKNAKKISKNDAFAAKLFVDNKHLAAESCRQDSQIYELQKNHVVCCISIFCIGVSVLAHTTDHE